MMAFGDLFLEDVRRYREAYLAGTGMAPLFPIWGLSTDDLAREMVEVGLRARVTCVDPRQLPPSFAGRDFDAAFLSELPEHVDPCGEHGEFHTFAYDGPDVPSPRFGTLRRHRRADGFHLCRPVYQTLSVRFESRSLTAADRRLKISCF